MNHSEPCYFFLTSESRTMSKRHWVFLGTLMARKMKIFLTSTRIRQGDNEETILYQMPYYGEQVRSCPVSTTEVLNSRSCSYDQKRPWNVCIQSGSKTGQEQVQTSLHSIYYLWSPTMNVYSCMYKQ